MIASVYSSVILKSYFTILSPWLWLSFLQPLEAVDGKLLVIIQRSSCNDMEFQIHVVIQCCCSALMNALHSLAANLIQC